MPGFEYFGIEEKNEINDVISTGVLFRYGFDSQRDGHWKAKSFEQEFAKKVNANHCLLVSSGTAALSAALAACGIGYNDEVIVPPFTFVATIESIIFAGAIPVFANIDETLCLDPNDLESKITKNTKAIIPVHMCGSMANIEKIQSICKKHNLLLIEDTCQSTGATINGKALGTFGDIGCFSFDSVKTITCGEGGCIITNDELLYKKADQYSDHGHDHNNIDRGAENHNIFGFNFRICELNAAIGLAQLKKLDMILEKQRENKKLFKDELKKYSDISLRVVPDEKGDSATFLSFFLPTKELAIKTISELKKQNVDSCTYWYDNNWHYIRKWNHLKDLKGPAPLSQKQYENLPDYNNLELEKSDDIISRCISMQIKLSWTQDDINIRLNKINNVLKTVLG